MKLLGYSRTVDRFYIYVDDVPLVGHIAFGIVDRGTNVLQIRPTTLCRLNCIFCSVDAGPRSRRRLSEYVVDPRHLIRWVKHVVRTRGDVDECLIDGVGDPITYPWIVELVKGLKEEARVSRVALETHGAGLTLDLVKRLEEAGLDRINLSIDTLDPEKARYLQGVEWFDVREVARVAEFIARETSIDLHLTPLWIPGINDEDIERIVEWGLRIGAGKRFPPFGIQKYEVHKYGRKVPGAREISWSEFWKFLEKLERKYGVDLVYWKLVDRFGMRKVGKRYSVGYKVGDKLYVTVVAPGWLRGEVVAVDRKGSTLITVVGVNRSELETLIGRSVRVKIIEDKDGIYIARRC